MINRVSQFEVYKSLKGCLLLNVKRNLNVLK